MSEVDGDPNTKYKLKDGRELTLDELVEECRHLRPTEEELRRMVRSFVYGNCALDNPNVTYELVVAVEKEMFEKGGIAKTIRKIAAPVVKP